jgi:hypothetical protein
MSFVLVNLIWKFKFINKFKKIFTQYFVNKSLHIYLIIDINYLFILIYLVYCVCIVLYLFIVF